VLGAKLIGKTGPVKRIREEDEASEVRLDRGHARDPASKRLTAAYHLMSPTRSLDEDGDRSLGAAAGQVDSHRIDAARLESDDVGLHRRGVAGRAVAEYHFHKTVLLS
jgi:hypothetical protein